VWCGTRGMKAGLFFRAVWLCAVDWVVFGFSRRASCAFEMLDVTVCSVCACKRRIVSGVFTRTLVSVCI